MGQKSFTEEDVRTVALWGKKPTIESVTSEVQRDFVWCQGWSPKEGRFGKIMLKSSSLGDCALGRASTASGCKNVTYRDLDAIESRRHAEVILAAELAKWEALNLKSHLRGLAARYIGSDGMGVTLIGDSEAQVDSQYGRRICVINRVGDTWSYISHN